MKKLKVMTLVGTRPEIIKLSRVINLLDQEAEHVLVHSGQNYDYELSEVFFENLGIRKPDYFLDASGSTSSETIGNVIIAMDKILAETCPDAFLLLGDTNSCLASIAVKKHKIPIFHMEAGNRCFDQCVPEEVNRKLVDHVSDINMPYSEHARRYLLAEGLPADRVIKTGSPMKEVIASNQSSIDKSSVLEDQKLKADKYIIVSSHREENVDREDRLNALIQCLNIIADKYQFPVLVSTHPRTRKRMSDIKGIHVHDLVNFSKPFGFHDYLSLQKNAYCVLSDSGTLTEESALLGFPAVMLRESHERPEGMDEAVTVMSDFNANDIERAIELARLNNVAISIPEDYNIDNVSTKVVRIIYSYTNYVNRKVWQQSGVATDNF